MSPQPKRTLGKRAQTLAGALMAIAVFAVALALTETGSIAWFAVLMIPVLAATFMALGIVHATGYVLGAWVTGMRIVEISVGPVRVQRRLDGVACAWFRVSRPGLAVMTSTQRQRFQLLGPVLGPLVALLVVAAVCIVVALEVIAGVAIPFSAIDRPSAIVQFGVVIALFLAMFWPGLLAFSIYNAAVADLQHLDRRNNEGDRRYWALREVERVSYAGVRPRDWDAEGFDGLSLPAVTSLGSRSWRTSQHAHALLLMALHDLDSGQPEAAEARMDQAVSVLRPLNHTFGLRSCLLLWRTIVAALYERDVGAAKRMHAAAIHEIEYVEPHLVELAQSAIALVEQDHARVHARVMTTLDAFPKAVDPGVAHLEIEQLEWMIAESTFDWTDEQHAEAIAGVVTIKEMLAGVVQDRAEVVETRQRWKSGHMVPRVALVAFAALVVFATPVIAGTRIGNLREDDGRVFTRPAQLGAGSDTETVAALLSADEMPEGWVSWRATDAHWYSNGPAMPCSTYAMFHEGEVQRYARGGLDLRTSRQPHYIRQVIADSEPALAMVVMDQIRAERDCHFWDDEEDLDYWVEPLDAPMIGEEAVAYLYTSYRYRDDTFWEANVVVTRVGGTILFIIHGQLDDPPVEQETYEIARLATDKVALAVPTWEPVEPKSPEAEAAVESSGGVVWWAGGLPFFLSLPFMVYVYVNGVFVACQLSVVRATGLTVRYVVLIPVLVVRRGHGIRVSFRWLSPFSTVNPFVGASHSPDLDDEQMAAYLESSYRVNILVALGAAVTITLAVVAIRVSTDSSWILMVVLLIAPGSLLLSVVGTYRQWMAYRQMVREKNPSLVRAAAYNRVVWQALGGVRPRDWNATDIAKLQHYPDGAVDLVTVLGFALAHSCYLDRGDIQQARQTLHQTLSLTSALPPTQMPPVIHTMVTRAAVWFAARYERDAIHARGLLSQIKSSGIERYEERLVEASVMATEGRSERARRMLESALRDIGDAVDPGSAVYMEEQARLMLAELDGATPSPSPTF